MHRAFQLSCSYSPIYGLLHLLDALEQFGIDLDGTRICCVLAWKGVVRRRNCIDNTDQLRNCTTHLWRVALIYSGACRGQCTNEAFNQIRHAVHGAAAPSHPECPDCSSRAANGLDDDIADDFHLETHLAMILFILRCGASTEAACG